MGRGTSRRMVEGKGAAVVQDMRRHIFEVAQNIGGFDPQNLDPLCSQPLISSPIMRDLFDVIVPAAIHLNRQRHRSAVKIQHIRPNRMLAAEFQPLWSLPEPLPQSDFWWRHNPPQVARIIDCLSSRRHRAIPLHHSLCERSPSPSLDGEDLEPPYLHAPSRRPSFLIFSCHTSGARRWTFWPSLSTATVTGMSATSNS